MNDDFNSALALAHMNDELRNLNKTLHEISEAKQDEEKQRQFCLDLHDFKKAGETLGFFFMEPEEFKNANQRKKIQGLNLNVKKIEGLITERNNARAAKDWKTADACRDELSKMDIALEDTTQGTTWKFK